MTIESEATTEETPVVDETIEVSPAEEVIEERAEKESEMLTRMDATAFSSVDKRTFEFPFSSEHSVKRYFGNEVLSHRAADVDLARLNDSAPLLFNHDPDKPIGVVERAWVDEKKKRGYARVRFSTNPFAQEVMRDVEDGILRGISVGYMINKMEERGEDVVATSWSPYEISVAVIPSDPSIGINRSLVTEDIAPADSPDQQVQPVEMESTPDLEVIRCEAVEAERTRIATISAMGDKFGMSELTRELIDGGRTVDEAREAILTKLETRNNTVEQPIVNQEAPVVLNHKEDVKRYSFVRVLNALANPADRNAQEAAAYEREVSDATAQRYGKSPSGFLVPNEVLSRDLTVGTNADGGFLVETELDSGSFIELLRNKSAILGEGAGGATLLQGLQGMVSVPKMTSSSTAYWVGEGASPTESQQAFEQVNLAPKTVGAFVDYSRRLLLQSSISVETMIRNDLAQVIAKEIDRAALYGTGSSNQPKGIFNTTGVGSVTIAGGAGTYGSFAEFISAETSVAAANAEVGSMVYIINANARGALKSTEKATNTGMFVYENDQINGYSARVSNQLANSDVLFGALNSLIVGMWSGLDLATDPYTGATAGNTRIIALQDMDFACRYPEAFCKMSV